MKLLEVMVILAAHPYAGNLCLSYYCCFPGEMYFHLITPLAVGAVALAMLTVSLGRNEYAAFVGLMLAATSQASNPLEWGYPATYLHGPALTSGWAVANCISAYGGAALATLQHGQRAFNGVTCDNHQMHCRFVQSISIATSNARVGRAWPRSVIV